MSIIPFKEFLVGDHILLEIPQLIEICSNDLFEKLLPSPCHMHLAISNSGKSSAWGEGTLIFLNVPWSSGDMQVRHKKR